MAAHSGDDRASDRCAKELHFFRDQQGLEVDFLIPRPNAGLWPVEAKASKTVRPAMAAPHTALRPVNRATLLEAFQHFGARPLFFLGALGQVLSPFSGSSQEAWASGATGLNEIID
jgi:hypothetical protein